MTIGPTTRSTNLLSKGSLRTAIAASIVVTYLFMLSLLSFYRTPGSVGILTQTFVENFTALVGVTIAFYFGASTAVQIFGKEDIDEQAPPPSQPGGPGSPSANP
jgi:hypothetical protein